MGERQEAQALSEGSCWLIDRWLLPSLLSALLDQNKRILNVAITNLCSSFWRDLHAHFFIILLTVPTLDPSFFYFTSPIYYLNIYKNNKTHQILSNIKNERVLLTYVFLVGWFTGQVRLGLGLTPNWFDWIKWTKNEPATDWMFESSPIERVIN